MASSVFISDTIRHISKQQWNKLSEHNPLTSYGWLLTVEETLLGLISPNYFIAIDSQKIVAAAVCYRVPEKANVENLDDLLFGRLKPAMNALGVSFLPAMVCCAFKSSGDPVLFNTDLDMLQKEKIAGQLIDAMEAECRRMHVPLSFRQVYENDDLISNLLIKRGYSRTLDRPMAYLDIQWDSFQGYKNHIRKKSIKWKRNISQDINRNKKCGVRIEATDNYILAHEQQMFELINRNYFKYNKKNIPHHKNLLSRLKKNLGEDVNIYRGVKNGRTTGVSVVIKRNRAWSIVFVGINHDSAKNDATYFNVIFYHPIMDAITTQIYRIYYGNGLYAVKIRRGCDIIQTCLFYKTHNSIFNFISKGWLLLQHLWYQKKMISYGKAE